MCANGLTAYHLSVQEESEKSHDVVEAPLEATTQTFKKVDTKPAVMGDKLAKSDTNREIVFGAAAFKEAADLAYVKAEVLIYYDVTNNRLKLIFVCGCVGVLLRTRKVW